MAHLASFGVARRAGVGGLPGARITLGTVVVFPGARLWPGARTRPGFRLARRDGAGRPLDEAA